VIKSFWDKLNKKQRYFVAGGLCFVLLALILELVIVPFGEMKVKLKQSVQANQKKLDEIIRLDAEFTRQQTKVAAAKRVIATRPRDFTLFSYVEKQSLQAGVKGHIKSMSSSRGIRTASLEEAQVDIRLDKITIKQLTDFLYYIELPQELVKINRITISKMKESPEYLSAQLQLASFQSGGR
jgi:type II secretory pathway component PulM